MPFDAECTFCHFTLQGVPNDRRGCSVRCPRCGDHFTLAPMPKPVTAATFGPRMARKKVPASSASAVAEAPASTQSSPAEGRQSDSSQPQQSVGVFVPVPKKPFSVSQAASLASFVLGSAAFLLAAITQIGSITLALGIVGLLLGILGWMSAAPSSGRRVLAVAGPVVSLAAVIFAVFVPHLLGLDPLWSVPPPPARQGTAVISLGGNGGFRDAGQGESPWIDASRDALHHGDVRVRILSAVVGTVEFEPIRGKLPLRQNGLVIRLRITNAGITRKIPYTSWGDAQQADAPLLHDNRGKSYRTKTFGSAWIVKGRARNSTIPSGKSLDDVLVFEAVPSNIDFLHLELPASAAGAEGRLRIEIPRKMIVFR